MRNADEMAIRNAHPTLQWSSIKSPFTSQRQKDINSHALSQERTFDRTSFEEYEDACMLKNDFPENTFSSCKGRLENGILM